MAIPRKDSLLLPYALNFSTRITASPITFDLVAADATALSAVFTPYQTAMAAIAAPGAKSPSGVATKNAARASMVPVLRELYAKVQASTSVSDANKGLLGVRVRKASPTPLPAPSSKPAVIVKSVSGWAVTVALRDSVDTATRGKPAGVLGAAVFSFVGEAPPSEIKQWKFEGNTGQTTVVVEFDPTLAAGTRVWITAFWFNPAKMSGPACDPVGTNLQGGGVAVAAS